MSESPLRYELRDDVAVLHLDDGKANAVSPAVLDALGGALDRAEKEAQSVVLLGRPGRFSAGFDLGVMGSGADAMKGLVGGGAEMLARMAEAPLPIVAGCTGHALAMGALLLLGADARIGTQGAFKIGLNEVAIGMTLPWFAVELARERLSRRHLIPAVSHAHIYAPAGAVDAGFLDRAVAPEELEAAALAEASQLGSLSRRAFSETKRRLRGDTVARIRKAIAEEF